MRSAQFDNSGIQVAGNLYLPDEFDEGLKYLAVIGVHPGGGVKEQTADLYSEKLAGQGVVTLAFDASHQGASGGEPRFLDFDRVESLLTQPLLVIAGSEARSLWHSEELHAKAPGPKELVIIDGATHMDLYNHNVDDVMVKVAPFFTSSL